MRSNKLRATVERGEALIGTWVNMARDPAILTLCQAAGLDFVRFDMEHSAASMETVSNMAVTARALDFPLIVRPPAANREWITRLLDCGVWNLHCPQITNAKHAEEVVAAAFYAPLGLRGYGGMSVGTDYDLGGTDSSRRAFANDQVFLTAMLETRSAFDELDAIAGMEGIGALTIGPADLAQDYGMRDTPGEAAFLEEKRNELLEACRKHGKAFANMASSVEDAVRWRKDGAQIIVYGSDVSILHGGLRDLSASFRQ